LAHDPTKARLLEAAGEEFAEKGFEGATIRSISQRAGANLAAINYHFGDKEHLYEAALIQAHNCSKGEDDERLSLDAAGAEEGLRQFIRHFLTHAIGLGRARSWHDALMIRESLEPTSASDSLVREAIRPRFERLLGLLRALCPGLEDRRLHALAFSVVGQCLHYKFARPISVRLLGEEAYARLDVDFLTDHIASFCLAAIGLAPTLNARPEAVIERNGG